MKKIISIVVVALMLASMLCVFASAEKDGGTVYVTISDGKDVVVISEAVSLSSLSSGDIGGALKAVHEKHGKTFATVDSDYGPMITSLWSVENGGAYGYYLNDASAWSLADALKDGDRLYAFVYSDATYYSDSYSYFDKAEISGKKGDEVTLTLSHLGYDESWNTVTLPLAGATLTLDGASLDVKTDENGKATVKLTKSGVLSAKADGLTLVPPVCVVTAKASFPVWAVVVIAAVALCACACVCVVVIKKKK